MSKVNLADFVYFGRLFEIYGSLLSEDRQNIMTSFFVYNMTLAEIADEKQISRQGANDAINKSCQKLLELENKLQILKKRDRRVQMLTELLADCQDETLKKKVENILKEE